MHNPLVCAFYSIMEIRTQLARQKNEKDASAKQQTCMYWVFAWNGPGNTHFELGFKSHFLVKFKFKGIVEGDPLRYFLID